MKYEITKLCPIIRFRTGETEKIGGEITSASDFAAFSDLPDGRVHRGFSVGIDIQSYSKKAEITPPLAILIMIELRCF